MHEEFEAYASRLSNVPRTWHKYTTVSSTTITIRQTNRKILIKRRTKDNYIPIITISHVVARQKCAVSVSMFLVCLPFHLQLTKLTVVLVRKVLRQYLDKLYSFSNIVLIVKPKRFTKCI